MDDERGVADALNEIDSDYKGMRVRCRHYLAFSNNKDRVEYHREIQHHMD